MHADTTIAGAGHAHAEWRAGYAACSASIGESLPTSPVGDDHEQGDAHARILVGFDLPTWIECASLHDAETRANRDLARGTGDALTPAFSITQCIGRFYRRSKIN